MNLPEAWQPHLAAELDKPYFRALAEFLEQARHQVEIYPAADDVFAALAHTPYDAVKAVILGQDPYHDAGQAHGLSFSVRPGIKAPPSLVNIFKELHADLGCGVPVHGDLSAWARQGVLLLNTVLTVEAHRPGSHRKKGWEEFTDAVIARLSDRPRPMVFLLWGAHAQAKKKLIDTTRHAVLEAAHPSPLSARTGFFGSRPFSTVNKLLRSWNQPEIDWRLTAP